MKDNEQQKINNSNNNLNSNETQNDEIDYSVYNMLNLMSPTLGECYKDDNYNPFPQDYQIAEYDIEQVLTSKKDCKKIEVAPSFIEMGINASKQAFKLSLANTTALKEELIKKSIESDILSKPHCDKVILYLKNREALLKKFLTKMKSGSNILEMLQELEDLDPELAKLIKSTYDKNFNLKIALDNLILFIMKDAEKHPVKKNLESEKELFKTKEILISEIKKEIKETSEKMKETAKKLSSSINIPEQSTIKNTAKANKPKPTEIKIVEFNLEKQLKEMQKRTAQIKEKVEIKQIEEDLSDQLKSMKMHKHAAHKKIAKDIKSNEEELSL